jgi:hypothetical protein
MKYLFESFDDFINESRYGNNRYGNKRSYYDSPEGRDKPMHNTAILKKLANQAYNELFGYGAVSTYSEAGTRFGTTEWSDGVWKTNKSFANHIARTVDSIARNNGLMSGPILVQLLLDEGPVKGKTHAERTYMKYFNASESVSEATVEMDAINPEDKEFLKFLKKHNVKIIKSTVHSNGHPEITMQGKRKDLEAVLADSKFGWDDPDLAEYIKESELNEGRIQYKRQYTENHPARTMNSNTKVRGKVLSKIGTSVITEDELNTFLKELNAHPRWIRRNSHLLKVTEKGYTLSKEGQRMSRYIETSRVVNEALDYSEVFKILDAAAMFTSTAHEAADQVWQHKDDLIDYLLSDHIPKKFHKKFLTYVK